MKLLTHESKLSSLLLALIPAGWFCGADLHDELRPGPAAGTAAEAGEEMSARLRHLSV